MMGSKDEQGIRDYLKCSNRFEKGPKTHKQTIGNEIYNH